MTVANTARYAGPFTGTGVSVPYPFSFKVFQTSDLKVVRADASGVQTDLALSVDFTATLNADQNTSPGGTVTLATPLPVGYQLTLTSDLAIAQTASLTNNGGFYPKVIEDALDRLTILMQEQGYIGTAQTLRVPEVGGVPVLPPAASRALKLQGYDADGNPSVVAPVSGSASDLALLLASYSTSAQGAGMVGFDTSLNYAAGTIGAAVNAQVVNAMSFAGVSRDGATECGAAINAVAAFCGALVDGSGLAQKRRPVLYFPAGIGYLTDSTIVVPGGVSVLMDGPLLCRGAANTALVGMQIGATTVLNQNWRGLRFDLDVRRVTQSDWTSSSDMGIDLQSAFACQIGIRRVENFYVGARVIGSYNTGNLGEFRNCQQGLLVEDSAYNFSNQNTFVGGEFAVLGSVNIGKARYGIHNRFTGSAVGNSNRFFGQSYELSATGAAGADSIPALVNGVQNNQFLSQRVEGCGSVFMKCEGDARFNSFESLITREYDYQASTAVSDSSTYKFGNRVKNLGDWSVDDGLQIFDSGPLGLRYVPYGSGLHFIGMEGLQNTSPATFTPGVSGVVVNADKSISLGTSVANMVGVRVNTQRSKAFAAVLDQNAVSDVTLNVVAFNSAGTQLTDNTDVLTNAATPTNTANLGVAGGLYSMSTALDAPRRVVVLRFSDRTASAWIGVSGGSIYSMSLLSVDGPAEVFTGTTSAQPALTLKGSKTMDWANLASGSTQQTTVTVTGASVGDRASAVMSLANYGLIYSAEVTSTDTVTVTQRNVSGSAIDLASGTLTARVYKEA